jgi:PAS domain S-box-containing protein
MAPGHPEASFPAEFEAMFHPAPAGHLVTGTDGNILAANDTFLDWAGLERAAVQGTSLLDLFPVGDRIMYATHVLPQLATTGACGDLALDIVGSNG